MFYAVALAFGAYLLFAGMQGEYGLFRRVQIQADVQTLQAERDRLALDLAEITNRTTRLSDRFLDLDLLDQQARDILGYMRADEIVLR